jgi:alcohol dehydrogenase class IV
MRVGIPSGLSAKGIQESHLSVLADKASEDACHRENPRVCSRVDLLTLYRESL